MLILYYNNKRNVDNFWAHRLTQIKIQIKIKTQINTDKYLKNDRQK